MHHHPVAINWDEFVAHSDALRASNPAYGAEISLLLTYAHLVWLRVVAMNAVLTFLLVPIIASMVVASSAPFIVTILGCSQRVGLCITGVSVAVFLSCGTLYGVVYDVLAKYAVHYIAACDVVSADDGMHPRFQAILRDLHDLVI